MCVNMQVMCDRLSVSVSVTRWECSCLAALPSPCSIVSPAGGAASLRASCLTGFPSFGQTRPRCPR
uniref:Uncharacterized protein n=1 Tax=Anguilla anguilla TaxID=7936 RepID=A0A0E9RVB5_ANGAN